jgi:hypothetical protein
MPAGPRHAVLAATIVLLVALAAPGAALAGGGGNCSACQVYSEQSGPNAGRKQQPPPQQPTSPSTSGEKQPHVTKKYARVLQLAGRDRGPLKKLLTGGNLGALNSGPDTVGSPSLLGAAFDLGTGPMILLSILLATALGLAARGSLRGWRLRRRPPPSA